MAKPSEIRTQHFTSIVGETYATVRNVYGRPGRESRQPGPARMDFSAGTHRRYIFADAVAWRITRNLSARSLEWDTAAQVVNREKVADYLVSNLGAGGRWPGQFFAIWSVSVDGKTQWAAWRGSPSEIAEVIEVNATAGEIGSVLMVSCDKALAEAEELANAAGYAVVDGHFVAIED